MAKFGGIITPLTTPFNEDGSMNYEAFEKNVRAWDSWQLDVALVNGSGGEFIHTSPEEQYELVRIARRATTKPVLAGVRDEGTAGAIETCKKVAEAGADAALVLVPFYWRSALTVDRLVEHYRKIADASPIPIMIYANPPSTLFEVDIAVSLELASHPNIVGIKDSTLDIAKLGQLAQATKDQNFVVHVGRDSLLLPGYVLGCAGGVVGMSASMGPIHKKLMDKLRNGDFVGAAVLQHKLTQVGDVLGTMSVIPALKALVDIFGLYGGPPRLPLVAVDADGVERLRKAVEDAGIRDEF